MNCHKFLDLMGRWRHLDGCPDTGTARSEQVGGHGRCLLRGFTQEEPWKPGSGKITVCQGGHFTTWLFKAVLDVGLAFLPWHPAQTYCRVFSQEGLKMFLNFNVGAHTECLEAPGQLNLDFFRWRDKGSPTIGHLEIVLCLSSYLKCRFILFTFGQISSWFSGLSSGFQLLGEHNFSSPETTEPPCRKSGAQHLDT